MKFGGCVPFPDKLGIYNRYVFVDSPDKKGSVIIVEGEVMHFQSDKVVVIDNQAKETTIDVLMKADAQLRAEKMTVAYVPIEGVGIVKANNPLSNGKGKEHETKHINIELP